MCCVDEKKELCLQVVKYVADAYIKNNIYVCTNEMNYYIELLENKELLHDLCVFQSQLDSKDLETSEEGK
jgi:hypothetical protein